MDSQTVTSAEVPPAGLINSPETPALDPPNAIVPNTEGPTASEELSVERPPIPTEGPDPSEAHAPPVKPVTVPISEARLRANRANAQKSRGPTTAWGKRVARRNALRAGQRAKILLLDPSVDASVSEIRQRLELEFLPVTVGEQVAFDMFLITILRNRRLANAEFNAFNSRFPFEADGSGRLNLFIAAMARQTESALTRWEKMLNTAAEEEEEDLREE